MPGKHSILIVDKDPGNRAKLQQLLFKDGFIVADGVGYDEEALTLASQLKPHLVMVALERSEAQALKTVQSFTQILPTTPIIVYSTATDAESVRKAKLAGAWDYLTNPVNAKELTASIERALNGQKGRSALGDEPLPEERRGGTIITVFGAKGGVGKTLLAVNLTASMAKAGASPVIVDLDTVFGDVAKTMRLAADRSFVDAAQNIGELDEWTVDSYLVKHPSGINVLPAPREPIDWRQVDPKAVDQLLSLLAKVHEFVIIDTPATFTDLVIVALRRADIIFLVSSLHPTSIEDTATALKILGASPADHSKIKLTLNHLTPNSSLSEAEAAQQLGQEAFWSIPYDDHASRRDEEGMPLVLSRPKAKMSRRITSLSGLLEGLRSPTSQKG